MKRFKNIGLLLHLDRNNDAAMQYAVDSAEHNDAQLYLICADKQQRSSTEQQQIKDVLDAKLSYKYRLIFLTGQPVIEVCRFVAGQAIDLLIMKPDIKSGLKRFFFGSLTLSLLRKIACPIWVVKPQKAHMYQRILICVDPMAEEAEEKALNHKLIEIGTALAKRESAECHLLCAWHLPGEDTLNGAFISMPTAEIEALKTHQKVKVARAFEALQALNKTHLTDCQTHLHHGEPVSAVTEFVDHNKIDLVVMGTLARSGVQGFVMGNTAEAIINQLECSIMAIKVDGFVSPIP